MRDNDNEPNPSPKESAKDAGGEVDLPPGFAPLTQPPTSSPILPPRPLSMKPADFSDGAKIVECPAEDSQITLVKPILARYPMRKPLVEVVRLDPAVVYSTEEAHELIVPMDIPAPVSEGFMFKEDASEASPGVASTNQVEPRYPSIKPVALDREKIYGGNQDSPSKDETESEDEELPRAGFSTPEINPVIPDSLKIFQAEEPEVAEDSVLDDIELTIDEESAFQTDGEESEKPSGDEGLEDTTPIVPDPDVVAGLVAKKLQSSGEIEVMGPEQPKREELVAPEEKLSKWAFWRRPSKRDQQLARISEGYLEVIDLVRAIRGQLESQNENNVILRDTLSHIPEAMRGLDQGLERFSESQQVVGKALGEIHTQMKTYNEKDERLAVSIDGFNDTLKGMDDTSKATMKTFDRVQERMSDSDIRMENLFQNVQNTEEKVSDTMVRLQRNMAVMQYIFLGCLMVVIAVLVFTVIKKQDELTPGPQIDRVEPKPESEN